MRVFLMTLLTLGAFAVVRVAAGAMMLGGIAFWRGTAVSNFKAGCFDPVRGDTDCDVRAWCDGESSSECAPDDWCGHRFW